MGFRYHIIPVVPMTKSGVPVGRWLLRLLKYYADLGIRQGPAFRNRDGKRARLVSMHDIFFGCLREVQNRRPDLISPTVDVEFQFGLRRSLRRGSTTEVKNANLANSDLELNNRWRKKEKAGNRMMNLPMTQHYLAIRNSLASLMRYSEAL